MKRFMKSLLSKYMFIVISALFITQLAYLVVGSIFIIGFGVNNGEGDIDTKVVEDGWHKDVSQMSIVTEDNVKQLFEKWKEHYPEAGMFWVDGTDKLRMQIDPIQDLPDEWTAAQTSAFHKERYNGDPFTVVAFAGEEDQRGLLVIEIPRTVFDPPMLKVAEEYGYLILVLILIIVILFILISFIFFRKIQKRLVHLQNAMGIRDENGLPVKVDTKKEDEIGQLEKSFNKMVEELQESRRREQEEEQIRRELIANLSHDLRTPLTKVRAHSYSIMQEELSDDGLKSVRAIETSIANIDRLIENLMSYTLLLASRYKYNPKEMDVSRFVRESLATWYPVFEKEEFEIDVETDSLGKWKIDPIWMERVLDNLFQNVLRYAKSGKYLGVKTEFNDKYQAILIIDHGEGFNQAKNSEKGAGIGLTIVDMMVKGMELDWKIDTGDNGTTIRIIRYSRGIR